MTVRIIPRVDFLILYQGLLFMVGQHCQHVGCPKPMEKISPGGWGLQLLWLRAEYLSHCSQFLNSPICRGIQGGGFGNWALGQEGLN